MAGPSFLGLEIGDWATRIGAIGAAGAAIAAVVAAKQALAAAKLPLEAAERNRAHRARITAEAMAEEMVEAETYAKKAAGVVQVQVDRSREKLLAIIPSLKIRRTAMLKRSLIGSGGFGEDGAEIVIAVSGLLNVNRLLSGVERWEINANTLAGFLPREEDRLLDISHLAIGVAEHSVRTRTVESATPVAAAS